MGDALAPWHIIILVIVLVLLFGAKRLPGAARSLGESMHIFKKSVQGQDPNDMSNNAAIPATDTAAARTPQLAQDGTDQQLADLQRQVQELQRQSVGSPGAGDNHGSAAESQRAQPL